MLTYPKLDDLKQEALHRGYIPIETELDKGIADLIIDDTNIAFDTCCYLMLHMYHTSSIDVTPIESMELYPPLVRKLKEENINTMTKNCFNNIDIMTGVEQ